MDKLTDKLGTQVPKAKQYEPPADWWFVAMGLALTGAVAAAVYVAML